MEISPKLRNSRISASCTSCGEGTFSEIGRCNNCSERLLWATITNPSQKPLEACSVCGRRSDIDPEQLWRRDVVARIATGALLETEEGKEMFRLVRYRGLAGNMVKAHNSGRVVLLPLHSEHLGDTSLAICFGCHLEEIRMGPKFKPTKEIDPDWGEDTEEHEDWSDDREEVDEWEDDWDDGEDEWDGVSDAPEPDESEWDDDWDEDDIEVIR